MTVTLPIRASLKRIVRQNTWPGRLIVNIRTDSPTFYRIKDIDPSTARTSGLTVVYAATPEAQWREGNVFSGKLQRTVWTRQRRRNCEVAIDAIFVSNNGEFVLPVIVIEDTH